MKTAGWLICLLFQLQFTLLRTDVVEERLKSGPRKNDERFARLEDLFKQAGCNERLTEQPIKSSKVPNVICTLPGEVENMIVVGAHFDNQGAGQGIVDNWAGAALLPNIFQSLKQSSRKHTFVFIGFTEEEKGLLGSKYYVAQLSTENVKKIQAMVNLDTVGLTTPKLWLSRADKYLANAFYAVAKSMNLPLEAANFDDGGSTDSESFRVKNIPSVTVHSLTQATLPILHSSHDVIAQIDRHHYYETYRVVTAYLTFLDGQLK